MPRTPYRRIIEENNGKVPKKVKERLRKQYDKLNTIELKRKIDRLQKRLYNLYEKEQKEKPKSISSNIPNNNPMKQNDFVYNFDEATK